MSSDERDPRTFADLVSIVLLVVAMVAVVFVPWDIPFRSTIRILLGVPFLVFAPGFAIAFALYPRSRPETERRDEVAGESGDPCAISYVERFVLSLATSLVVVALVALASSVLPWGVRAEPLVVGVAGITLLAVAVGARKRVQVDPDSRPGAAASASGTELIDSVRTESMGMTLLNVVMVGSVMLALASFAIQPFGALGSQPFSAYQLLAEGENGDLVVSDYPDQFSAGENESLFVRIQNREGQSVSYTVVVQLQRMDVTVEPPRPIRVEEVDRLTVAVDAGDQRTIEHAPSPTTTGDDRLVYLFYRADVPANPSRETADGALHLWMNASDPGDGSGSEP